MNKNISQVPKKITRFPLFLLTALGLLVLGAMLFSLKIGSDIAEHYAPHEKAVMEIKLQTALAHLWFEENIRGDNSENINEVWRHLDKAEWYAKAMLDGGENLEGKIYPLEKSIMRNKVEQALKSLGKIRQMCQKRWETQTQSETVSRVDQEFDRTFSTFHRNVDQVETAIRQAIKTHLQQFNILQGLLIAFVLAIILIIGTTLRLYEKRRQTDLRNLQSQEENLRITLNSIGDAVIATDTNGKVTQMNPIAENLTGWKLNEAKGRPLTEVFNIVHAKTGIAAENPVGKVLATGNIVGLANHTMLISKNKTEYQISDSGAPIKNSDGEISGVVLVFRDVTKEYVMEETLRENSRNLAERNKELNCLFNISRLVEKDTSLANLLQDIACVIPSSWQYPEIAVATIGYDGNEYSSSSSKQKVAGQSCEIRIKNELVGIISVNYIQEKPEADEGPFLKEERALINAIGERLGRILERKQTENTLQESEGKYRAIVDHQTEFVNRFLPDGTIVFANRRLSELVNMEPDELNGKNVFDFLEKENAEKMKTNLEKIAFENQSASSEQSLVLPDGSSIHIQWINSGIFDKENNLVEYQAIGRDITEHVKLEKEKLQLKEALNQSQKMEAVGKLAGGIAHNFNNILNGILGQAELLKEQTPSNAIAHKTCETIMKAVENGAKLPRELLALSHKKTLEQKPINIHHIIDDVVRVLSGTLKRDILLKQECNALNPVISGDSGQLQQMVLNFGVNAGEAIQGKGELTFSTHAIKLEKGNPELDTGKEPGHYLILSIQDTGCGISDDIIDSIYEPFFSTKDLSEASGLGLASVFAIVQDHNGWIQVESEINKGTTFRVYLPAVVKTLSEEHEKEEKYEKPVFGRGRILIADDEKEQRDIYSAALQNYGYQVQTISNGKDALQVYRDSNKKFNLVILDMNMPEMDGKQCFEELKKMNPDVKVIFATGLCFDDSRENLIAIGAADVLSKPFLPTTLAKTVAKALKK